MQEIGLPEVIGIIRLIAVDQWWLGLSDTLLSELKQNRAEGVIQLLSSMMQADIDDSFQIKWEWAKGMLELGLFISQQYPSRQHAKV